MSTGCVLGMAATAPQASTQIRAIVRRIKATPSASYDSASHQDRHAGHQTYQIGDRLEQLCRGSQKYVEKFAHRRSWVHSAGVLTIIKIIHQRLRGKGAARTHEDR